MYVIKRNESEENTMDIREKAVQTFGFEDCRTITICVLVEQGRNDLAEQLFEVLTEGEDDSYDEWDDADLEMGFDPYSGCYDFDC
jgi:hypothetical protein